MPLTYMNASGRAIAQFLAQTGTSIEDLLVVCDDVDLPMGQLRLRKSGSDGGHRGLRSIVESLSTEDFARLRLGVGPPPAGDDTADFVLDEFSEEEAAALEDMLDRARQAIRVMTRDGIDRAMTLFNRKIASDGGAE
jgi:PTH1 family peptidyl-tRNA hydrolase